MKLSRTSLPASLRLSGRYTASPPKPDIGAGNEAESSTAAQKRHELESGSSKSTSSTNRSDSTLTGYYMSAPKRRRGPNALSLLRAQKFAKALESAPPPSKINIPQISDSSPGSPPAPPTLADLEAKRPDRDPPQVTARSYSKQYKRLYDSIEKAFVARQILKFAGQLGVRVRKGRGKDAAIRGVMKVWGWEDPKVAEAMKLAREPVDRDWELSRAELWLIMRDESFVRPALEDGIKLSVPAPIPGSEAQTRQGKRILRGHGDSEALAELDQRIADRRAAISAHSQVHHLGHKDPAGDIGLLGTISNVCGAFIEPLANETIRLSALDESNIIKATTLLIQASAYASHRASTSISLVSPSPTLEMSLFPHIPSAISAIPWQEVGKLSKPLFRVRGIQPWETKVGMRDVTHREENLGECFVCGLSGSTVEGKDGGLANSLAMSLHGGEGVKVTARFGHLLFPDATPDASLLAPSKRARWSAETSDTSPISDTQPLFLPSPPPAVIQFPIYGPSRKERRLRYRSTAVPGRYFDISHVVRPATPTVVNSSPESRATNVADTVSGWHKELDAQLASLEIEGENSIPEVTENVNGRVALEARVVDEKAEDLMMPDRPIDSLITSSRFNAAIDITDLPSELSSYVGTLEEKPPSTFEIAGQHWSLHTAEEVEFTEKDLSPPPSPIESEPDVQQSKILLRSVKSTDLILDQARVMRYAELETDGTISPAFWQQLAVWSRAVAPGAGQLRNAVY